MGITRLKLTASRRSAVAVAGFCVVASLAAAPGANASRGVTRTGAVSFPPSTKRLASASCPAGAHLTTGGFLVSPGATAGSGFKTLTQVNKIAGTSGWTVQSASFATNPAATLIAYARCERKRDGRIAIRSPFPIPVNPGEQRRVTSRCPDGTHPIGGGWSINNPYDPANLSASSYLTVTENRQVGPRSWAIAGQIPNVMSLQPSTLTTETTCEYNGRRKITVRSKLVPYLNNVRTTATATCPKRKHVVSGGFLFNPQAGPPPGNPVPFPYLDRHSPVGSRSWRVDAYDLSAFPPPAGSAMTVYAYCRKNRLRRKRRHARRRSASAAIPVGPPRVTVETTPIG
jgi:hypothetical protein